MSPKAFIAYLLLNPPAITGLVVLCSAIGVGAVCILANNFDVIIDIVGNDELGGSVFRKVTDFSSLDAARDAYSLKK